MYQPPELSKPDPLKWSPGKGTDVWSMFCASRAGDLESIKRLLGADPSLARCHFAYRTPLYFAVRENQREAATLLLEHGADPLSLAINDSLLEICRDRGYAEMESMLETFLSQKLNASSAGEAVAAAIRRREITEVVSLLDQSPALLGAGDRRSNQPIHWAAMTRQLPIIDELLARGANVDAVRYDGARPIQLAGGDYYFRGWRDVPASCTTTATEVIEHLLRRGAFYDICTACHLGDIARVRELLDRDGSLANRAADYTTYYIGSGSPLKNAAAKGHHEIVRLLLERGADPNLPEVGIAPRGHALYAAAANGHYEVAKLLLEHGAFPNPEVESSADALCRASGNSDEKMSELLCSHGAASAVHLLAYYGDIRTAAAAFAANPGLAEDPEALANAAGEGQWSFLKLMLRYVPDLPRRVTFPDWSVGGKSRAINELLFAHGLDPNQPDWLGVTPLHQFARKGNWEAAELFLDRGANIDARDEDCRSTPLAWAAKHGQTTMIERLLARGAKTNLPDDPPWATPLAWARRRGRQEIAEILIRNGAR